MVVRYDYRQPQAFSHTDLRRRGDPVVTGYDRVYSVLVSLLYYGFIDAIAVPDPFRNLIVHIGAAPF